MGNQKVGVGTQTGALMTLNDQQIRQVYASLFNNHGELNLDTLYTTLMLTGAVRAVDSQNQFHYEQEFTVSSYTVDAIVAPLPAAPGDPVSVRIVAADHNAQGNTAFRVQDHVTLDVARTNENAIMAHIATGGVTYTANANVVTLYPNDPLTDFTAGAANEMTVGTRITITSNSNPEFSDSRRGLVYEYTPYQVNWQILRDTYRASGTALTLSTWMSNMMGAGDSQTAYETMQMYINSTRAMDGALLLQQINTNPTTLTDMGSTFDGLIPTIVNRGGITLAIPGGAYTRAYVDTLTTQLEAQGAPKQYLFLRGFENMLSWNALLNDFPVGSVRYADPIPLKSEGYKINTMMDSVKINGYELMWKQIKRWSHPNLEGSVGDYTNTAIGLPQGMMTEGQGGAMRPQFEVLFLAKNGYSRKDVSWTWGGAAEGNKNGQDGKYIETLSEVAPRYMGVNQMVLETPYA